MSAAEMINYLESPNQTPRQRWGTTALQKHFHQQKRDFEELNYKKDLESIDVLLKAGYKPEEVEPIIQHFNAGAEWIRGEDAAKQYVFSYTVETQILSSVPPEEGHNQANGQKSSPAISWIPKFFR